MNKNKANKNKTNKNAMGFKFIAPVIILFGALAGPGGACSAQGVSAATVQLAQIVQDPNKKPAAPVAPRPAQPVRPVTPHPAQPHVGAPAHVNTPHQAGPKVVTPGNGAPKLGGSVQSGPKTVAPGGGAKSVLGTTVHTGPKTITRGAGPKTVKAFTPRGPRARTVTAPRLRGFPTHGVGHAAIRGHNYSVWRHERRFRYHGGWRTFVALGALGAIAIGAAEYYPYAYIDAPADYCDGLTEDGCQLVWQDVETVEGDVIPQCVAFCPWQ